MDEYRSRRKSLRVETVTVEPPLVRMADACLVDIALVGAKAHGLARLAAAGYEVPGGFVLTSEAIRAHLAGISGTPTPESVFAATLPQAVEDALQLAWKRLGDVPLAVRSSAASEDAADASFAGLFESVLDVRGLDGLREAVRRCWASAFRSPLDSYIGAGVARDLAVIVQPMIGAEVAGVAFTADPLTGRTDRVLVSAVPGSGAALLAGTVDGDDWVVDEADHPIPLHADQQALTAEQAVAVARLARRIEASLGGPQDIEWAIAEGRIVALQARPITVLPRKPAATLPKGRVWFKDRERYPEPITALGASLVPELVAHGLSAAFAESGALVGDVQACSVGGEFYISFASPGRPGSPPPPAWLFGVLARVNPGLRRRCAQAKAHANPDALRRERRRWRADWRPELEGQVRSLVRVQLAELTADELTAHLRTVLEYGRSAMRVHFHLMPAELVPLHTLVRACRRLLGWDEGRALALVTGSSPTSTAPSRELAELVAALSDEERTAVSAAGPERVVALLGHEAPGVAAEFELWCRRFAYRSLNDDPGSATLIEQGAVLGRLLFEAIHRTADDEQGLRAVGEQARAEARRRLRSRPRSARSFEVLLDDALDGYGVREDVAFWTGSVFGGLLRLAALEVGRRLVRRGRLGRREDAVQLDAETLLRSVDPGFTGEVRAAVAQAHAERAWVRLHPGPDVVGTGATPPRFTALPRHARVLNSALAWTRTQEAPVAPAAGSDAILSGIPASPGTHLGRVRVVRGIEDFSSLRSGEVLVCPTTDPAWSVLFGIAGALVTDVGGPLSHAAIVAREHGLPAVLATHTGTQTLTDGMLVTVDGSTGQVRAPKPRASGVSLNTDPR